MKGSIRTHSNQNHFFRDWHRRSSSPQHSTKLSITFPLSRTEKDFFSFSSAERDPAFSTRCAFFPRFQAESLMGMFAFARSDYFVIHRK
jgi:hypothetical protein